MLSAITFISFYRADYLHKETNGYHIWKNNFRNSINYNFSKRESNVRVEKQKPDEIESTPQNASENPHIDKENEKHIESANMLINKLSETANIIKYYRKTRRIFYIL